MRPSQLQLVRQPDKHMTATAVVEGYTDRWSQETTYQEVKTHLQVGSTRCRARNSVLREAPFFFVLYSIIMAIYASISRDGKAHIIVQWKGKTHVTFSDALSTVRRLLWKEWIFRQADETGAFEKMTPQFQRLLLAAVAPAT